MTLIQLAIVNVVNRFVPEKDEEEDETVRISSQVVGPLCPSIKVPT